MASLARTPGGALFNPWYHHDRERDVSDDSPGIRRRQLVRYLSVRQGQARYLLIAEALGYQGGRFTGIAMTSERILLGYRTALDIHPRDILPGLKPQRTSRVQASDVKSVRCWGFTEPTATIVWSRLLTLGLHPLDFVLWNAVPWHPYRRTGGMLTNRTPAQHEQDASRRHLGDFLALYPDAHPIAMGSISRRLLSDYGDPCHVRHPSNGGATRFRREIEAVIKQTHMDRCATRRTPTNR